MKPNNYFILVSIFSIFYFAFAIMFHSLIIDVSFYQIQCRFDGFFRFTSAAYLYKLRDTERNQGKSVYFGIGPDLGLDLDRVWVLRYVLEPWATYLFMYFNDVCLLSHT